MQKSSRGLKQMIYRSYKWKWSWNFEYVKIKVEVVMILVGHPVYFGLFFYKIIKNGCENRCIKGQMLSSMTSLLTHTVAHSTRPSFRLKTNNQHLKKFLSLEVS